MLFQRQVVAAFIEEVVFQDDICLLHACFDVTEFQ